MPDLRVGSPAFVPVPQLPGTLPENVEIDGVPDPGCGPETSRFTFNIWSALFLR